MSEPLKAEFEEYLSRYRLKPRKLPSRETRRAGMREVTRLMYEDARSRGDPMAESILIAYEMNEDRYLEEGRHPAAMAIEAAAAEVEATIRALPAFAAKFHDRVLVGEFPTGSINCQTVKVDGGFLVLVNSGTLAMLQQVVTFLWHGDADRPDSSESLEACDGVAEVLASYVEHGDPFYGPKPLSGGMLAVAGSLMTAAATKFVVAHEYGHILAGHLADPEPLTIETEVGAIEVIRNSHAQEFEADDIGYRLTLGVADSEDFDLAVIDIGRSNDLEDFRAAVRQKCLIAAPFVPLAVDAVLEMFYEAMRPAGSGPAPRDHPSALDRIGRLMDRPPGKSPNHSGFINLPFMLLPSADRIVKLLTDRLSRQSDPAPVEGNDEVRDAPEEWFDEVLRCAAAIRRGDFAAAALILTDAFEKQQTLLELDVDVVRRGLVRTALGRPIDIGRTLLDRHRERRAVEEYVESSGGNPLLPLGEALHGGSRFDLAKISHLVPGEQPKGLSLVKAVLTEEVDGREGAGPEASLLDAILAAWSGEREGSLASFEAALAAGVADPDGRLARFVTLEKRAIDLGVQLDIQKLLVEVGAKAVGDKRAAQDLAGLVKAYTEYLGVPLGPLAQRMIDTQMGGAE